ncbi:MAG: leucine-rich repeat domain-containing protein [Clostridiales bacterium]|nr:leucine-rich repeat domain-containing protein [Clostridiales bacterium]
MIKKAWLVLAAIVATSTCAAGLVACADENAHTHEYISYVYNNDATCGNDGTETAKCEKCDKTDTRKSEAHPATGEHSFVDYICETCFALSADAPETQGLAYSPIREDHETVGYSVSGKGSASFDKYIKMPSEYDGRPVTGISNSAFENCESLVSISIPSSITSIEYDAFKGCDKLIRTDGGVRYADKWVVGCDYSVKTVELRFDTFGIAQRAFWPCDITSITIPNGVKIINASAFNNCGKLKNIIFNGTTEEWKSIIKGESWDIRTADYTVICTDGELSKEESGE